MKLSPFFIFLAAGLLTSAQAQDGARRPSRLVPASPSPTVSMDGKVTFRLTAPKATEVLLRGDWDAQQLPMTKDEKGEWTLSLQLKPQIYSYSFLVDGVKTLDPRNPQVKLGRNTNASSVEVPGTPPMLWEMRDVPHGQVISVTYRSEAAGDQRRVTIYTPLYIPHYDKTPSSLIRTDEYKLIYFHGDYVHEDDFDQIIPGERYELYRIREDISETRERSRSMPDITGALKAKLQAWLVETGALMPVLNPDFDPENWQIHPYSRVDYRGHIIRKE